MPPPHDATDRPRVLITMGDPTGLGPEVAAAAWPEPRLHAACRPVLVGDPEVLRRAIALRQAPVELRPAGELADALFDAAAPGHAPCLDIGAPHAADGQAAYQAILQATNLTLAGRADAMVTGPISKAALQAAGHDYPGHTELIAELCGVDDFAMMLYLPPRVATKCPHGLAVVHVTLHTALRSVFDQLTPEAILAKCRLAHNAMRAMGAERPRIGVAALNPHAGEGGLFGDEESRVIAPAVEAARMAGVDASGPHPVDTLMVRARDGEFDAVVAMYHDQGHIALKLLGMHEAVNVTLGLPIVRASVAHGTAPDIAWRGVAETSGMLAAAETAAYLARRKHAP